jgi:hypothetical protein
MEIQIPGGTATLRDTLTIRERREIQRIALGAMSLANQITGDSVAMNAADAGLLMDTQDKMADATLVAYLQSWTLDKPLPTLDTIDETGKVFPGTIDEMDGDVYDAITAAIEKNSALAGVDTSPSRDKQSPMLGSPFYAGTSKDEPTPTLPSTTTSSNGTESTVSESSIPA